MSDNSIKDTLESSDPPLGGSDVLILPPPRRIMRLAVTPQLIMSFYDNRDIHVKITENGIPEDAKYLGCAYDFETNAIWIYMSHETFKEVRHGAVVPILDSIRFQTMSKCDNCTVKDEKGGT